MKELTKEEAIRRLVRNGVLIDGTLITVPKHGGPGIKLWGVIDYLKSRHGFAWNRAAY